MRLGVVTTSYPRFAGDPAGNFVAGHVEALRALGHRVEVIAAGAPIAGEAGVTRVGVARLFADGGAPDALERRPVRAGVAAAELTARLTAHVASRARRWDAIVAHWLVPSAIAALPARRPLVAIAHGGDVFTLRRLGLLGAALHLLRRRRAALVFVARHLRELACEAAPSLAGWLAAAPVQPMGLDVDRFAALPRAPATPPRVLVVSRLVPVKGIDVVVEAMRHVATPARLVVAGDGPEGAALRARAPDAEFVGAVATSRRDELLAAAALVVVPSRITPNGRTEGTPMIALEALAAGVPVVASAVGGLRELPGVCLVPPEEPRALAAAIDRTLACPPSPEHLRAAVAGYAWREVAPRLLRV